MRCCGHLVRERAQQAVLSRVGPDMRFSAEVARVIVAVEGHDVDDAWRLQHREIGRLRCEPAASSGEFLLRCDVRLGLAEAKAEHILSGSGMYYRLRQIVTTRRYVAVWQLLLLLQVAFNLAGEIYTALERRR